MITVTLHFAANAPDNLTGGEPDVNVTAFGVLCNSQVIQMTDELERSGKVSDETLNKIIQYAGVRQL
jgi:hypothetical protein